MSELQFLFLQNTALDFVNQEALDKEGMCTSFGAWIDCSIFYTGAA